MSELINPRTPKPEHAVRHNHASSSPSPIVAGEKSNVNVRIDSPVNNTGTMTPPPSTQLPKQSSKSAQARITSRREHSLASPPPTLKTSPPINSGSLFGEMPSLESVREMDESQLRGLVTELLPAFGEARVSAAHSKLQHSLLSIETEEAAKRAVVEHEATRREVQVLQESSPIFHSSPSPISPQASMQRNLHLALAHCRELQQENVMLERRLRSSKKVIAQLNEKNADLKDDTHLLRQRIKDNRDHLNDMQSTGAISINTTPVMEYSTPLYHQTPRTPATISRTARDSNPTQDPFDALLLAGQVMNGEASSVPASPQQVKAKKSQYHHVRGAHSLSSLPTTPQRSRPLTADHTLTTSIHHSDHRASFSAPGTQPASAYDQEDRESTISASDNGEETYRRDDIPGSQASQVATNMLRRSLESQSGSNPLPSQTPESSRLMQAKLFGHVTKPLSGLTKGTKRGSNNTSYSSDMARSNKKIRVADPEAEKIGLGIRA